MFPLKNRSLIRGCQAHKLAGLGCGADYVANYQNLYMPFTGTITGQYFGTQGGNWLIITDPDGNSLEFAHLDKYICKEGEKVKQGEVIAITGNTGHVTTGPHLHIQIIDNKNRRIDPEKYNWTKFDQEEEFMSEAEFREIVTNVVNGFYLTYYKRQGTPEEITPHVDEIMKHDPRKYCISDWVNRQVSEPEFLKNWGIHDDAWKIQTIAKLRELVNSLGG